MKLNYKSLLLSTATALILTACGGSGRDESPTTGNQPPVTEQPILQTKQAKAQLGVLSGAKVEIHQLGVTPYKLLHTEITSTGDSIETVGNFNAHHETLEEEKFYLYKVSNGLDMDANDDGVIDAVPTVNVGSFHAIVQGKSVKNVKGDFKVTAASELLYKKVKADINDTEKLEAKLDSAAKEIFEKDIDEDSEVSSEDILQYNPVVHKDVFKEAYQEKLPQIIKDIHENKKKLEKQAPTANAGGDKSIVLGDSITLKASGLDIDGSIVSYRWNEGLRVLSDEKSFDYTSDTLGSHILTLTVTDNDNLEANARVNITIVEKPNTAPSAKSASYELDENGQKKFTLQAEDKENATLTYKVLLEPIYGQLTGKAPNLLYRPRSNYHGEDKLIFVANDAKSDSKKATIKFKIKKSDKKPIIVNDGETLTTEEDTSKSFTLQTEAQEGKTVKYIIVKKPSFGKLINNKKSFVYTPDTDFNGEDSFIIKANDGVNDSPNDTIMITVTPINDAPTVDAGDTKSTIVETDITLNADAKDIDGKIASYKWLKGALVLGNQKQLIYQPTTVGAHTLSVTVADDDGLEATDSIIVTATEQPNKKPIAQNQNVSMDEDTQKEISLKATDADEDTLTYSIVSKPKNGTLSGKAPAVTYAPKKDYNGKDSFTFRASDGKDDSNVAKVSLTIKDVIEADTEKPIITLKGAAAVTVIQGKAYTEAGATATDKRDGAITVVTTGSVNTAKVGIYTLTYTATDKAGNKATKTRIVTVTLPADVTKPVITLKGVATITIIQGKTYKDAGATATDARDGTIIVKTTGSVNTAKVGTYKLTYTATDKAGNKSTKTRTVTVVLPASTVTQQYASVVLGYSSQYGTSSWSASQVLGEPNVNTYGDRSSAWAPKASNDGSQDISVGFAQAVFSTGVTIRENYGNGFVTKIEAIDEDNALHTVWSGTDSSQAGEVVDFSPSWTKTTYPVIGIKVTIDTDHSTTWEEIDSIQLHGVVAGSTTDKTPPFITLKGSEDVSLVKGKAYTDAGATAIDARDGSVTVKTTGTVNSAVVGTYTITYTATDKAGNRATKTRKVTVVLTADTVKPVITLKGATTVTVIQGQKYTELSATAKDDRDGVVAVSSTGTVNTSRVGTYTITYTATDKAGNKASKTRKVTVVLGADTVKPVITLWGTATVTIIQGKTYRDAGAKATDARDGTITVKTTGSVNTSKVGIYTLTFTATDKAGNKATKTRKVTVVLPADVTRPVITLKGTATVTIIQGSKYTDAGATATDARDGGISIVTTGSVNTAKVGTYTLTFTATDKAGNKATKTRKIIVEKINTLPTANAGEDKTGKIGEEISIYGSGTDSDGGISSYTWREGSTILSNSSTLYYTSKTVGKHTLTLTVTDDKGATANDSVFVTIKKNIAPRVSAGPDELIESGDDDVWLTSSDATDADGRIASYTWREGKTIFSTKQYPHYAPKTVGKHTLTLTVTDDSGATASDTIVVISSSQPYNTFPRIKLKGGAKYTGAMTLNKRETFVDPGVEKVSENAKFNYKNIPISSVKITGSVDTSIAGIYYINYTVIDSHGYTGIESRAVRVLENLPPVITLKGPETMEIEIGTTYVDFGATAEDFTDGVIAVTRTGTVDTSKLGDYTITYTATDKGGEKATKTRTVTVTPVKPEIIIQGPGILKDIYGSYSLSLHLGYAYPLSSIKSTATFKGKSLTVTKPREVTNHRTGVEIKKFTVTVNGKSYSKSLTVTTTEAPLTAIIKQKLGNSSYPDNYFKIGSNTYFSADVSNRTNLYRIDNANTINLVKDLGPETLAGRQVVLVQQYLDIDGSLYILYRWMVYINGYHSQFLYKVNGLNATGVQSLDISTVNSNSQEIEIIRNENGKLLYKMKGKYYLYNPTTGAKTIFTGQI